MISFFFLLHPQLVFNHKTFQSRNSNWIHLQAAVSLFIDRGGNKLSDNSSLTARALIGYKDGRCCFIHTCVSLLALLSSASHRGRGCVFEWSCVCKVFSCHSKNNGVLLLHRSFTQGQKSQTEASFCWFVHENQTIIILGIAHLNTAALLLIRALVLVLFF